VPEFCDCYGIACGFGMFVFSCRAVLGLALCGLVDSGCAVDGMMVGCFVDFFSSFFLRFRSFIFVPIATEGRLPMILWHWRGR